MQGMTAQQIAADVHGRLICGNPQTKVLDICTDSRKVKEGDLYVPIIGARVDGHQYLDAAAAAGAAAVFDSRNDAGMLSSGTALIAVPDTLKALQDLGRACRKRLNLPFTGITGSVGKTSTRTMTAAALSASMRVFQTEGNENSQIGVPITLSRVTPDYDAAVIELGMSEPGEMSRIAAISGLNIAVITGIGVAHIEQLGSQEAILREKLHITDGFGSDNCLVRNGDDPLLCPEYHQNAVMLPELEDCLKRCRSITYGLEPHNDIRAEDIRTESEDPYGQAQESFTAVLPDGERVPVKIPVTGEHYVRNALAALACAWVLDVPVRDAALALSAYRNVSHRQERLSFPDRGITVIDDSYNASPDSMKASISAFMQMPARGKHIAVLADMWELGSETSRYHREVGRFAGSSGIDVLLTVGKLAEDIAKGAREAAPGLTVESAADQDEARIWLEDNCSDGDMILLKGSNGMRLYDITAAWNSNAKP